MAELSPNVSTDYPITQYRLVSTDVDQDGEVITTTKLVRSVQGMLSVSPRESVSTVDVFVPATSQPPFISVTVTKGTWTKVSTTPISDLLCMEVTESRRITIGPATGGATPYVQTPVVREDKWDDENGVLVSTFWQYVSNTYVQEHFVGDIYTNATYAGGSVYAYNSVPSYGILDAGTGYTSIPTLAVAAPTTGGTNATGTVTSLKLTDYTVTSYGSGWSLNNVATLDGGSFSTAATLTVSGMGLASASLSVLGTGYLIGDQITLTGGINTSPAIVSVASYGVSSVLITNAGTGIVPTTEYDIDTGGTATTLLRIRADFTKAVSIAFVSGATSSPDGIYACKGTTGTFGVNPIKVNVTVFGGVVTSVAISSSVLGSGKYSGNPPNLLSELLTTDTGTPMIGYPTISMVMGIFSQNVPSIIKPTIINKGSYSDQAASLSSSINGIALTPTWGISTVTVDNAGSYTTALPTTLYQLSTTGVGDLAEFQTFTWTPNALTISNAGVYTASANGNRNVAGAGTGLTLVPSFGIGAVSVVTAGTGYRTAYPTVTLSYGNAKLSANPDTKAIYTASAAAVPVPYSAYVISSQIINTEHALIKKSVWVAMPLPFPLKTYPATGYNFPAIFLPSNILLDRNGVGTTVPPPTVGYDYTIVPARSALFPARTTRSFSVGPQAMPTVFSLYSYQSQTKYYPQLANCSHSQFNVRIWRTDKDGARTGSAADDVLYEERVAPSSPVYSIGSVLTIQVSQKRFRGNIWEMEVTEVSEYPLL